LGDSRGPAGDAATGRGAASRPAAVLACRLVAKGALPIVHSRLVESLVRSGVRNAWETEVGQTGT
jgi:hypothetical protein